MSTNTIPSALSTPTINLTTSDSSKDNISKKQSVGQHTTLQNSTISVAPSSSHMNVGQTFGNQRLQHPALSLRQPSTKTAASNQNSEIDSNQHEPSPPLSLKGRAKNGLSKLGSLCKSKCEATGRTFQNMFPAPTDPVSRRAMQGALIGALIGGTIGAVAGGLTGGLAGAAVGFGAGVVIGGSIGGAVGALDGYMRLKLLSQQEQQQQQITTVKSGLQTLTGSGNIRSHSPALRSIVNSSPVDTLHQPTNSGKNEQQLLNEAGAVFPITNEIKHPNNFQEKVLQKTRIQAKEARFKTAVQQLSNNQTGKQSAAIGPFSDPAHQKLLQMLDRQLKSELEQTDNPADALRDDSIAWRMQAELTNASIGPIIRNIAGQTVDSLQDSSLKFEMTQPSSDPAVDLQEAKDKPLTAGEHQLKNAVDRFFTGLGITNNEKNRQQLIDRFPQQFKDQVRVLHESIVTHCKNSDDPNIRGQAQTLARRQVAAALFLRGINPQITQSPGSGTGMTGSTNATMFAKVIQSIADNATGENDSSSPVLRQAYKQHQENFNQFIDGLVQAGASR